ncbi:AT-rich interactive domain-containing protein 3A-like [Coregonus clupeaformis]|uniref:AT-rich interactive domain-containing protein 3A-like n=1 Tax=Coregonus clupeaformis TaxID=59861 RepID=UPI001BE0251B|nr:AT-rich interactive domain-containing protein 3A-like [Coregonus clupeaformis]
MENSKSQMPNLSQEASGGLGSPVGVRLEAVMEQLQRQQEAKLEMDRQEKHLCQAQMMFAKHVAATRITGAPLDSAFLGKRVEGTGTGRTPQMGQQQTGAGGSNANTQSLVDRENGEEGLGGEGSEEEEEERMEGEEENSDDDDDGMEHGHMTKMSPLQQDRPSSSFSLYSTSLSAAAKHSAASPPMNLKRESEEKDVSTAEQRFTPSNGFGDWSFDDGPFKQKGSGGWAEENEGGKTRGEPSRDFAKLYELDSDPNRKEFLDELFVFMQKRGTPVNRIPIMAKQILDLYMLYKLVTEKGGLVEVINKKIWREITRGLNLPTSITSAAFTLRTQYMKYLYPYECEKKGLSSPGELQAAIDGNRREGRRHSNSLYRFSPSTAPGHPHHSLLSPPKMPHYSSAGHNGLHTSPSPSLKRSAEEMSTPMLPSRLPMAHALSLGQQQQLAQATTLEHLREKLERAAGGGGEGPDRKMARLAMEEQQRLMQQAFQQNLLAMASHFNPSMKQLILNNNNRHESTAGQDLSLSISSNALESTAGQDLSLSISSNGAASISVSVEVNGTLYSGTLFAQKTPGAASVMSETMPPAGQSGFGVLSSSQSPSSTSSSSSKGPN